MKKPLIAGAGAIAAAAIAVGGVVLVNGSAVSYTHLRAHET